MNLDKFLESNLDKQTTQLDEGVKDAFSGLVNKIKSAYKASKAQIIKIGNKIFGVFRKNGQIGITDAAGIERVRVVEKESNGLRFYGFGFTNKTKLVGAGGGSTKKESVLLNKLGSELLEINDALNISPDAGDVSDEEDYKNDKTQSMRHMFGLGGQLKHTKIDKRYKQYYEGKPDGTITVEQMKSLFGRLAFQVKFRTRQTQYIPSILVFGSPGEAKTAIGTQVAKIIGCRYKSIEVASIYTEIFGGMPISQEVYDTQKEGYDVQKVGNLLIEGRKSDLKQARKKYGYVQTILSGNQKGVDAIKNSREKALLMTLQTIYLKKSLTGVWDEKYPEVKKQLQELGYVFEGGNNSKNENKVYNGVEAKKYLVEAGDGQKVTQIKKKIVELVPVKGVLPDPGNKDPWLLALDEFSRTDKKMSAVMNLLLTGAIGTIYFLPLKTIVAATSNLGTKGDEEDVDGEEVAQITGAMLTRFNFVVKVQGKINDSVTYIMSNMTKLPSDQEDPDFDPTKDNTEWEIKHKNFELTPELASKWEKMIPPSLWLNYVIRNGLEQGQYHRVPLESYQTGTEVKLNPRLIDRVSKNVAMAALQDWESGDLVKPVGKSKAPTKEWYEKNYKKEKVPIYDPETKKWKKETLPSPQAYYLLINQGHKRYLDILKASLMKGGKGLLADIEAAHETTQKQLILGDTEQILISHVETAVKYNDNEEKLAELESVARSAKDIVLDEIPKILSKWGSIETYKKKIKGINWKKMGFTNEYWYLATNIWRFTDDALCSGDEIAGLAIAIGQELVDAKKEETVEFLGTLASVLSDDKLYKDALDKLDNVDLDNFNFDDNNQDDIDDLFGESLNESFKARETANNFKKGIKIFINTQLHQLKKDGYLDQFNEYISKLDGSKILKYLKGLWHADQESWYIPVEVDSKKSDDMKKESKVVEQGLRKLFENLNRG